jgi:hydroxymethylglutaryl-CoA lyase
MIAGCPYQGEVPTEDVLRVTTELFELGCDEVSLDDTVGVGTPLQIQDLIARLSRTVLVDRLAVQLHDTYGQGLANTLAAFEAGIRTAGTSAGGLGGCPFAAGATGNLATEDLLYALEGSGVATGVDLEEVIAVTAWMAEQLGRPPVSRVARAVLARAGDH